MVVSRFQRRSRSDAGVTILEVAIASALVALGLGSIFTMSSQSLQLLQSARRATDASQILQQRAETIRLAPWTTVSKAQNLATLMQTAVSAEIDIGKLAGLMETVTVSTFAPPGSSPVPASQSFAIARSNGTASANNSLDLSGVSPLKVELKLTWNDRTGVHRHDLSTVVSKGGVSANGIATNNNPSSGAPQGLSGPMPTPAPTATPAPTPTPTATPTPAPTTPAQCKHGRTWPHCGIP